MKVLYALDLGNSEIAKIMDSMKYILDPSSSSKCHITARGPYSRQYKQYNMDTIKSAVKGACIEIVGIGNFFEYGQGTVYYKCNGKFLRDIWYKPDFGKDYNPHITIYNGDDRNYARAIYDIGHEYAFDARVYPTKLYPIIANGNQAVMTMKMEVDNRYIREITGNDVMHVESFNKSTALDMYEKLCGRMQNIVSDECAVR